MSRNIVVCSDGTGNTLENTLEKQATNVVRLIESLVLDEPARQLVIYDQGVGTVGLSDRIADVPAGAGLTILDAPLSGGIVAGVEKNIGLLFGYGLKKNVGQLYRALAEVYLPGDSLFLFGFSRGAFTVRALAGLLHRCQLPPSNAPDIDASFEVAWKLFQPMEGDEERIDAMRHRYEHLPVPVHFIGVWDTVKSYGGIRPVILPHLRHNPIVTHVRHALALDERRAWFQATTWGRLDMDKDKAMTRLKPEDLQRVRSQDICEVWFTGAHSDVGGGDESNPASRHALRWMLGEAGNIDPPLLVTEQARRTMQVEDLTGEPRVNDLWNRGWRAVERIPHWEIDNTDVLPRRVFRIRGDGKRHPGETPRRSRVFVHSSAIATPSIPESVEMVPVDTKSIG